MLYYTPSVCLSVCPMRTVNSKTESRTMFKLQTQLTHIRVTGRAVLDHSGGNVKIVCGAYLCEKRTNMTPTPSCAFCPVQCSNENVYT